MKPIQDWKYKDVPLEDVTDKYGYVTDLEFAKFLITVCWYHEAEWDVSGREWIENVNLNLTPLYPEEGCDEFTIRDEKGHPYLGGLSHMEGVSFQLLDKRLEHDCPEGNEDAWDLGFETDLNWDRICVVLIGGKPRAFITHESD